MSGKRYMQVVRNGHHIIEMFVFIVNQGNKEVRADGRRTERCWKTTLLSIIAENEPTSGDVFIAIGMSSKTHLQTEKDHFSQKEQ